MKIDKKIYFILMMIFILGSALSAIGLGCIPGLASVVVIPLASKTRYSRIILMSPDTRRGISY